MKIVFSQFFDNGYYIDTSSDRYRNLFNTSITGTRGLLNILERETGLSGRYPDPGERILVYNDILGRYLKKNESAFYGKSFNTDPAGVTRELLKWRDQLILSGWDRSVKGISERLDTLADIEGSASVPVGFEDRLVAVLKVISGNVNLSLSIEQIEIEDKKDWLHPFFTGLFEALQKRGIEVIWKSEIVSCATEGNLSALKKYIDKAGKTRIQLDPEDKKSLQIIEFRNELEAAEFICAQKRLISKSVILNNKGLTLNLIQKSFGEKASGAVIDSLQPQVMQIMQLSSSLFARPLNIYNLISYLQISVHPLPAGLRYRLLKIIGDYGGVPQEEWENVIDNYEYDGRKLPKDKILFAELWDSPDNKLQKDKLILFYNSLGDWARKRANSDQESDELLKRELNELHTVCKTLAETIKMSPEGEVQVKELNFFIDSINESMNLKIFREQRFTPITVQRSGQLISGHETIIWLDFYNCSIKPAWYDFINDEETTRLRNKKLLIWESDLQAAAFLSECKKAILYAGERIILVTVEKCADEDAGEHPLHSFIKAVIKNPEDITYRPEKDWSEDKYTLAGFEVPELEEAPRNNLPSPQAEHEISCGHLVKLRRTESYSSLEKLIDYPFDWVFEYAADIKPGKVLNPKDIPTVLGDVAHKFVENLFNLSQKKLSEAKRLLKEDFEYMLENAAESNGAQLLLEQHKFEYLLLSNKLKTSAGILLDIIGINQLEIIDTELEVEKVPGILHDQNIIAYVDLLLRDRNGKYIVFDLKWSRNYENFRKMISEGRAIQLALYRALLNKADQHVDKLAFFSLTAGKLITAYDFRGDPGNIIHVRDAESEEITLEKLDNSITFRLQQINAGRIEEAEGMPVGELEYCKARTDSNLLKIKEYQGKKSENLYSGLSAFKGKIK